jgi:hypothetical protein
MEKPGKRPVEKSPLSQGHETQLMPFAVSPAILTLPRLNKTKGKPFSSVHNKAPFEPLKP